MLTQMLRSSLQGDCITRVLACLNPGVHQFNETRNVLMYVHRATRVIIDDTGPGTKETGGEGDAEGAEEEEKSLADPMNGDVFDPDELQNRRCEAIETN
eukprot:7378653-Prymnesium_polylepis.1